MSGVLIIFFVLAALAVLGAISLIVQAHPIHSALSLILVMLALAGLYLLMGAEFVAAVQIIVYGGAVMVLFVFVIMLLNAGRGRAHQFFAAGHVCRSAAGPGLGQYHRGGGCALQRKLAGARTGGSNDLHAAAFHAAVFQLCVPV